MDAASLHFAACPSILQDAVLECNVPCRRFQRGQLKEKREAPTERLPEMIMGMKV